MYQIDIEKDIQLEDYSGALEATGFQAPGDEFANQPLNIHEYLVKDQASTYFMIVDSTEWARSGIFLKDILIVDASKTELEHKQLYVCSFDGVLSLKRCRLTSEGPIFHVDNTQNFVSSENIIDGSVFGKVIGIVRKFAQNG